MRLSSSAPAAGSHHAPGGARQHCMHADLRTTEGHTTAPRGGAQGESGRKAIPRAAAPPSVVCACVDAAIVATYALFDHGSSSVPLDKTGHFDASRATADHLFLLNTHTIGTAVRASAARAVARWPLMSSLPAPSLSCWRLTAWLPAAVTMMMRCACVHYARNRPFVLLWAALPLSAGAQQHAAGGRHQLRGAEWGTPGRPPAAEGMIMRPAGARR